MASELAMHPCCSSIVKHRGAGPGGPYCRLNPVSKTVYEHQATRLLRVSRYYLLIQYTVSNNLMISRIASRATHSLYNTPDSAGDC